MPISRRTTRRLAPWGALSAALLLASAGSAAAPGPGDDPLLVSSTYLGGNGEEFVGASALGKDGALWIVASSTSTDIPGAGRPPQPASALDVVVLRVDPATRHVLSAAWIGGSSEELGSSTDVPTALAFDSDGNAYVAGYTFAPDFPATAQTLSPNADSSSAFVARVSADGTGFDWVRVLGGISFDMAEDLCVTPDGDPVVVGFTQSADFPASPTTTYSESAPGNLFVTRLSADGSRVVFSSLVGGNAQEQGGSIAALAGGGFLVAGSTSSANLATRGRLLGTGQPEFAAEGFLAEIDANGGVLERAALLGGFDIRAIAVEPGGTFVLAGTAYETDSRIALPPGSVPVVGTGDACLVRFDTASWDFVGGTIFGGSGSETAVDLVPGAGGVLWLTGVSGSSDLPAPGAVRHRKAGFADDAFVAAFDASDLSLDFAAYLGGTEVEWQPTVAPDPAGGAWIAGSTASFDFPESDPAYSRSALSELFAAKVLRGDPAARPGTPGDFAVDATSAREVRLRWKNGPGAAEERFLVERNETDGFRRVATLPAGTSEWIDTDVLPDRGYTYCVQSVNDAGASAPTREIRVLTPASLEFRVDRGRSRIDRDGFPVEFRLDGRIAPAAAGASAPDLSGEGVRFVMFSQFGPVAIFDVAARDPFWRSTRRRVRWRASFARFDFRPATGAFRLRIRGIDLPLLRGTALAIRIESGAHAATTTNVWRTDGRSGSLTP